MESKDLIPPSNPGYPWVAKNWQLLCYYCNQPIYETKPVAGDRQRTLYMRGRWRHVVRDTYYCDPHDIRPESELDKPRCHCGAQDKEEHKGTCSLRAVPPYIATPFSQKEQELDEIARRRREGT